MPILTNSSEIWISDFKIDLRGMILKFWSRYDISVASDATSLKIVPNN